MAGFLGETGRVRLQSKSLTVGFVLRIRLCRNAACKFAQYTPPDLAPRRPNKITPNKFIGR